MMHCHILHSNENARYRQLLFLLCSIEFWYWLRFVITQQCVVVTCSTSTI